MEGKLLTILETMGLQSVQEKAVKSLVRQTIWNAMNVPYRLFVPNFLDEQICKWNEENKFGKVAQSAPRKKSK